MAKDNHHYVPAGYLRRFSIEGEKSLVWEYDKLKKKVSHVPLSVKKVCSKYHYYAQEDEQGNLDKDSLENQLDRLVESPAIRVIDSIPDKVGSEILLSDTQISVLAYFIGLLSTRVPAYRDGVHDFHNEILKYSAELMYAEGRFPDPPKEVKALIDQRGFSEIFKVETKAWVSLEPMLDSAEQVCNSLLAKTWLFMKPCSGSELLTSDNPVIFNASSEGKYFGRFVGIAHPLSMVYVPLRKDIGLVMLPNEGVGIVAPELKHMYESLVTLFNNLIISASLRYVYAPINNKNILNVVIEKRNCTLKMRAF